MNKSDKRGIRLGFAGDLMLGGEPVRCAQASGLDPSHSFKALLPTLAGLDVLFVNLEGPLFEDGRAAMRKPLRLSNHPAVVKVLKHPGICVCSLANNHSLDYGPDALFKTQRHLDRHGIRHLGAGRTAREAERELVFERLGWRISCLAFTASGPGIDPVLASARRAGCAGLPERPALLERVRRLRKRVDLLVVMLHWGREFHEYPSPAQVRLAHDLVEAGADLIAGHHSHAIQAMEEYRGSVIAYSLGHLFMPPLRLPMKFDGRECKGPPLPSPLLQRRRGGDLRRSATLGRRSASPRRRLISERDGPVFHPRPASKEFLLMRVEVPGEFPDSPGSVDVVAGGLDPQFKLRPYNRIGLQALRYRLDDLACPLRNGSYTKFWRHYRQWRGRQLDVLMHGPAGRAGQ